MAGRIPISNSGAFNIQTQSTEQINAGTAGTFNNSGTLVKWAPSTTSFGTTLITDAGNININSGTLSVQNILFTGTGGTVTLSGGTLASSLTLTLNNKGIITGVGTIVGSVNNTTGTVTPGLNGVPGTLTIQGNYTQAANGTLVINIDSAGNYGKLVVQANGLGAGGAVTLDGTLTVNRNLSFTPPQGYDIPFLTYLPKQLTGKFATVNIPDNLWNDPVNGQLDSFVAEPASNTTYDLVVVGG